MRRARPAWIYLLLSALAAGCGSDLVEDLPDGSGDGDVGDVGADVDEVVDPDADIDVENSLPHAEFAASPSVGVAPLEVTLDGSASRDDDGTVEHYIWDFGDGSDPARGEVVRHGFETAGCFEVVLTVVDDRGGADTARGVVVTTAGAPEGDPVFTVTGLPPTMAVVPRDLESNEGEVTVEGTVSSPGYHAVALVVVREEVEVARYTAPLCSYVAADPFAVTARIEAVLASHTLEVRLVAPETEVAIASVDDVVAGDVYLIQGQSNAVARQFVGDANVNQGPFIRSFGTRSENPAVTAADLSWHPAEGNAAEGPGAVGQWALHLGRLLVDAHGVPVAILNGARGGMPITYFQRNDEDPGNMATNYGRFLFRVRGAGAAGAARAVLYYQGESDGANAVGHRDGLAALIEDWREDFPSVEQVYVTQVRTGCGSPTIQLRDAQRRLADDLEDVSVMSTTGLDGHDGCHYAYEGGYELLGERYAALLGRDLHGADAVPNIDAPNVERIFWSAEDGTEVTIVARDHSSTLIWDPGAERDVVVEGVAVRVVEGRADGATLVLSLSGDGRAATGLSYLGHTGAGAWIRNVLGIGMLTFHALPVEAP